MNKPTNNIIDDSQGTELSWLFTEIQSRAQDCHRHRHTANKTTMFFKGKPSNTKKLNIWAQI